jgi:hypothetical protein
VLEHVDRDRRLHCFPAKVTEPGELLPRRHRAQVHPGGVQVRLREQPGIRLGGHPKPRPKRPQSTPKLVNAKSGRVSRQHGSTIQVEVVSLQSGQFEVRTELSDKTDTTRGKTTDAAAATA